MALPGLAPVAMSPVESAGGGTKNEEVASPSSGVKIQPTREPKLLFAAAKDVARVSLSPRSKKPAASGSNTNPTGAPTMAGTVSMRTIFGKFRRSSSGNGVEQQPQPQSFSSEEESGSSHPSVNQPMDLNASSGAEAEAAVNGGRGFVDDVRETLQKLVLQLDSVDARKLLSVRLGGELRGLLGKAQDEFAAYEVEFVEHASNDGVSVALQNFSASLAQVSPIAERLRTAKFLLNKTFKREVLFAFQEINSYYTSLFMELSMAIARRSGIELPLPAPAPPPPEPASPSCDELCLEAHQHFFGHGVAKDLGRALELYTRQGAVWYAKAAEQGHTQAEASLGRLYLVGTQMEQDIAKAIHFLQRAAAKAADAGSSVAMTRLANLLLLHPPPVNDGSPLSIPMPFAGQFNDREEAHDEALRLLLNAGNGGHTEAYYVLAELLEKSSLLHDQAAALRFYSKAAAATPPHTKAAKRVAAMRYSGIGCTVDKQKAHQFYIIAANAGDAEALNALGTLTAAS
ncbi:hypothetical protein BBJ28_00015987 [Nothophytophthora sp. Chile5]|nr:hypothetical protein BBJ28_00015987 [Nothophytophthora sp. Chile5]